MFNFEELHGQFRQFLQAHPLTKEPIGLYQPVDYIMNMGGKQIRPILLLMAHNIYQDAVEKALPLAYAVELFHSFSLLHDDVMDQAEVRRGQPTVHIKYGLNTAILSGDVMLIYVYKYITESTSSAQLPEVLHIFNQIATEVCEGQQLDMEFEVRKEVAIEEYINMIRMKTAVLLAGALEIGALTAGASKEDAKLLYDFGKNIGLAFQIQDDLLDTFGEQATFGKKIGGDIVQNKKTFLYLQARQSANRAEHAQLDAFYNQGIAYEESDKIRAVTGLFKKLEVDQKANDLKEAFQRKAFASLEALSCNKEKKQPLFDLAIQLIGRAM
jgi:geranylgeranyl diphosphate synthase type II